MERVQNILESANKEKIPLLWSQSGFKKRYFNFKQIGFNGANLFNVLNINTLNIVGATLLPTGAVTLTISGAIALIVRVACFLQR